ncbi:terpene synthase family protein [Streptomyces microflavus]|uniref:terpene synthase family protein n=1 Tax=Streptomyces microflavus TaxID=1919 RepID=UPI00367E0F9A
MSTFARPTCCTTAPPPAATTPTRTSSSPHIRRPTWPTLTDPHHRTDSTAPASAGATAPLAAVVSPDCAAPCSPGPGNRSTRSSNLQEFRDSVTRPPTSRIVPAPAPGDAAPGLGASGHLHGGLRVRLPIELEQWRGSAYTGYQDYLRHRRSSLGVRWLFGFAEAAHPQLHLPEEAFEQPGLAALHDTAVDGCTLINDLVSYRREAAMGEAQRAPRDDLEGSTAAMNAAFLCGRSHRAQYGSRHRTTEPPSSDGTDANGLAPDHPHRRGLGARPA